MIPEQGRPLAREPGIRYRLPACRITFYIDLPQGTGFAPPSGDAHRERILLRPLDGEHPEPAGAQGRAHAHLVPLLAAEERLPDRGREGDLPRVEVDRSPRPPRGASTVARSPACGARDDRSAPAS